MSNMDRRRFLGLAGKISAVGGLVYALGPSFGSSVAFGSVPEVIDPEKDKNDFYSLITDHHRKKGRVDRLAESAGITKAELNSLETELQSISLDRMQDLFKQVEEERLEESGDDLVTVVTVGLKPRKQVHRLFVEDSIRRTYIPDEEKRPVDMVECTFDGERFPIVKNPTWFLATVDGVQANYEVFYTTQKTYNFNSKHDKFYVIKQILEEGNKKQERTITLRVGNYRGRYVSLDSFEFLEDGHTVVYRDFAGGKNISNSDLIDPSDIRIEDMDVLIGKWVKALSKPISKNRDHMKEYISRLESMKKSHLSEIKATKSAIVNMKGRRSKNLALGPSFTPEEVITMGELFRKTSLDVDEFLALRGAVNSPSDFRAMLSSRGIKYDKSYGSKINYAAPLNTYNYRGGVCDELFGVFAFVFAGKKDYDVYTGGFYGTEGHAVGVLHDKKTKSYYFQSNMHLSSVPFSTKQEAYEAARVYSGYSANAKKDRLKRVRFDQRWLDNNKRAAKALDSRLMR
jgi:hypothetical protein